MSLVKIIHAIKSTEDFHMLHGIKFTILDLIQNIEFLLVSRNEYERDLGLEVIVYSMSLVTLSGQVVVV